MMDRTVAENLLLAFRTEAGGILANIADYATESNPGYLEFLRQYKINGAEIEPELRWMMIVAATCENRTSEAIAIAKDLQSQFPDWSAKRKIAATVEQLRNGRQAFDCR